MGNRVQYRTDLSSFQVSDPKTHHHCPSMHGTKSAQDHIELICAQNEFKRLHTGSVTTEIRIALATG